MPFGRYELLNRLRVGGMAEVWRAREIEPPNRVIALKRILPSFTDEADYVSMFIDEARLSMRLTHPAIVGAYELGRVEDEHYIALELVEGQDLAALIRYARERNEPVSPALACRIAIDVCEALHYAHELCDAHGFPLGIVHRDVSPQNVLVSYDGDVKLIDFGIAKSTEQLMRTQAGLLKGKHGYLSPEQAQGQPVDRRSDLFSLGICLYELLAARRLFQGSSDFSTIVKVRKAEIPALETANRDVPVELAAIVHRALARDRGTRFQTAFELQQALIAVVEQRGLACDRAALGAYVRERFATAAIDALESATAGSDENTGLLAAFDEVEPPTALSAMSQMPADEDPLAPAGELDEPELDEAGEQALASEPLRERRPTPSGARVRDERLERDPDHEAITDRPASGSEHPTRVVSYESTHEGQLAAASVPAALRGGASSEPTRVDRRTPQAGALQPARILQVEAPPSPPGSLGGLGLEWSDEELSTQIYDPPASEEPVAGANLPRRADDTPMPARRDPAPASMRATPHVPSSAAPTPRVTMSSSPPRVSSPAVVPPPRSSVPPTRVSVPPPGPLPAATGHPGLTVSMPPMGSNRGSVTPFRTAPPESQGPSRTALGWAAGAAAMLVAAVVAGVSWFGRPAPATLHVTTDPTDALVTVDGAAIPGNVSPFVASELEPDVDHDIEVSRTGYRSWRTRLRLRAGKVIALPTIALVREAGTSVSHVPAHDAKTAVPAGSPQLEHPVPAPAQPTGSRAVSTPSPAPKHAAPRVHPRAPVKPIERKVATSAPKTSSAPTGAAVTAESGKGTLRVNSRPWSRVYIDGRLVGNTPQMQLSLSPGWHTVTLVNPDFGLQKVLTIRIRAGEVETKIVDLGGQ